MSSRPGLSFFFFSSYGVLLPWELDPCPPCDVCRREATFQWRLASWAPLLILTSRPAVDFSHFFALSLPLLLACRASLPSHQGCLCSGLIRTICCSHRSFQVLSSFSSGRPGIPLRDPCVGCTETIPPSSSDEPSLSARYPCTPVSPVVFQRPLLSSGKPRAAIS